MAELSVDVGRRVNRPGFVGGSIPSLRPVTLSSFAAVAVFGALVVALGAVAGVFGEPLQSRFRATRHRLELRSHEPHCHKTTVAGHVTRPVENGEGFVVAFFSGDVYYILLQVTASRAGFDLVE